jgi:adenylate kinase family enzyme
VIVYDAATRVAILAFQQSIDPLRDAQRTNHLPIPFGVLDAAAGPNRPTFLCEGRAIKIYIFNRRLKATFAVSLTAAIQSQTGHPQISGYTPSSPGASAAPAAPPSTPGAKGFAPVATGTNLLTTDQIINQLLNEETFDRPLAKIMDDASAVLAQANQFRTSYEQYITALRTVTNIPVEGTVTVQRVTQRFLALAAAAVGAPDEKTFDDWTEEADRLQTDVARINTKLQNYPVVDVLTNLRASAATLNDNVRGVRNELKSLAVARSFLLSLINAYNQHIPPVPPANYRLPPYLDSRARAEIRSLLRSQYAATVDDATLARIVETYSPSAAGHLVLRDRLEALDVQELMDRWVTEINSGLYAFNASSLCGGPCLAPATPVGAPVQLTMNLNIGVNIAEAILQELREGIRAMNDAEAMAFNAINTAYDTSAGQPFVLTLDLTGHPKNLFVFYTISSNPQFFRYRIINETPQPQSGCALAVSANTNASGGAIPCTTPPSSQPPAASASFANTPPASATPAAPSAPAAAPNAAAAATPPPSSPPPAAFAAPADFYGQFEVHHFTNAALVTGFAYDSVTTYSFSWSACPLSSTNTMGSTTKGSCISPTPAAGSTAPTYYQLTQSKQVTFTAVQGINLYPFPKDTFTAHSTPRSLNLMPAIFIGAAIYPLNHYYIGLSEEPSSFRLLSITGGLTYGSQTALPSNSPFMVGSVATSAQPLSTSTHFRAGFFVMVGFHTSLFKAIFTGSAFQNTSNTGTAGAPSGSTTPASQ